jgi:hypothetical protein
VIAGNLAKNLIEEIRIICEVPEVGNRRFIDVYGQGRVMDTKELVNSVAADAAEGWWTKRGKLFLWSWVAAHGIVAAGLEVLGLFPGVSHTWDAITLIVGDEIAQLVMVAPAVKELWRRGNILSAAQVIKANVMRELAKLDQMTDVDEIVRIPLDEVVPVRNTLRVTDELALRAAILLMHRTGEWQNGQIGIYRAERRVYLTFRPTEVLIERLASGDGIVPVAKSDEAMLIEG